MKGGNTFALVLAGWSVACILLVTTTSTTEATPTISINSSPEYAVNNQRDFRHRRGFKTVGLATARGFGKRASNSPMNPLLLRNPSEATEDDAEITGEDTFPVDWLVQYLQKTPSVARYLVERLLDHNGDGQVTSSEMLSALQE